METKKFQKYLKERYYDQINWYDNKSLWNKKWYTRLQWGLIILSAMTPVLIAIDWRLTDYSILKWLPLIAAVLVAVLASALKTLNFQENWINYRTICETLRKEINFYDAGIGEYSNAKDKEALFVERVENVISRENSLWAPVHEEDKGTYIR